MYFLSCDIVEFNDNDLVDSSPESCTSDEKPNTEECIETDVVVPVQLFDESDNSPDNGSQETSTKQEPLTRPLVLREPESSVRIQLKSSNDCGQHWLSYDGDIDYEADPLPSDPEVDEDLPSDDAMEQDAENRMARDVSFLKAGAVLAVLAENERDGFWIFELFNDYSRNPSVDRFTPLKGFYYNAIGSVGAYRRDPSKFKSTVSMSNLLRAPETGDFLRVSVQPLDRKRVFLPWEQRDELMQALSSCIRTEDLIRETESEL